jgi:hypothetical protein
MNSPKKQVFKGKNPILSKLILWIILTLTASFGAYLANYALVFHLKSATFSWFGVWFALFGLAFQFWTIGLSVEDKEKGPFSITAIPEITAEILIISGLLLYSTNVYFMVGWIFLYPFYINLRTDKTKQRLYRPTLNFLCNYIQPRSKFNYQKATNQLSIDFLMTSISFLILDTIREYSVLKAIQPNYPPLVMFIVSALLFILVKIVSNPKNTNPSQPTTSKNNYE